MTTETPVTIGSPYHPHVVLVMREYLGPKRVATVELVVHGLTRQDVIDTLMERVAPQRALDDALGQLRAPAAARNGSGAWDIRYGPERAAKLRANLARAQRTLWARMTPARRAERLKNMATGRRVKGTQSAEVRSAAMKKVWERMTPAERRRQSEAMAEGTRRANQLKRAAAKREEN
jgi:hypothetical protein